MKQTAVEWLEENLIELFEHIPFELIEQAKEMEKQQKDDYAIDFVKWFLQNEEKIISIEYNTGEEAIKGLLEIFKNK